MNVKIIGNINNEKFFIKSLAIQPSELSDKMMTPKPRKKIENLFLLYLRFSFEVRINNNEIRIKTGKQKGLINRLNISL